MNGIEVVWEGRSVGKIEGEGVKMGCLHVNRHQVSTSLAMPCY